MLITQKKDSKLYRDGFILLIKTHKLNYALLLLHIEAENNTKERSVSCKIMFLVGPFEMGIG